MINYALGGLYVICAGIAVYFYAIFMVLNNV